MNLLAVPSRTRFDLNFRLFGIPIRIHPLFWLTCFLLGGGRKEPGVLLIWAVCVFFSILLHELGHVAAMIWAGDRGDIVLHGFGGLAIPYYGKGGPTKQAVISAAGPVAGFVLAALVWAGVVATGGSVEVSFRSLGFPRFDPEVASLVALGVPLRMYYFIHYAAFFLLYINIYWGLLNLLPVYPLDGGQMTRALWERRDPLNGERRSLQLSMYVAGAVALLALPSNNLYQVLLFGTLAFGSYQALQVRTPLRHVPPENPYAWRRY
ncbi:site-2 protease family protein [uncultured Paludibaculum sp.]|uniref:site-2 protease family protein n=1 Tax=uncultured Paludibaculum sp. TaxID=1765020 RepID=UPI002AAC27ED|nr:site-2 protease family protein [uncultured Paludibaculum sp.]